MARAVWQSVFLSLRQMNSSCCIDPHQHQRSMHVNICRIGLQHSLQCVLGTRQTTTSSQAGPWARNFTGPSCKLSSAAGPISRIESSILLPGLCIRLTLAAAHVAEQSTWVLQQRISYKTLPGYGEPLLRQARNEADEPMAMGVHLENIAERQIYSMEYTKQWGSELFSCPAGRLQHSSAQQWCCGASGDHQKHIFCPILSMALHHNCWQLHVMKMSIGAQVMTSC